MFALRLEQAGIIRGDIREATSRNLVKETLGFQVEIARGRGRSNKFGNHAPDGVDISGKFGYCDASKGPMPTPASFLGLSLFGLICIFETHPRARGIQG